MSRRWELRGGQGSEWAPKGGGKRENGCQADVEEADGSLRVKRDREGDER